MSSRSFRKDETIVSYDKELWFGYSIASATSSKLQSAIRSAGFEKLSSPILMSLNLLNRANDGDAYASTLKDRYCSTESKEHRHPLQWTSQELDELKGTSIYESCMKRSIFWRDVYRNLRQCDGVLNSAVVNDDEFLWSVSQVLSRALSGDNRPFTFVPGLCLFNHSDNANTSIYFHNDTFEVRSARDIDSDEELTINYGANRSSGNFLQQYGFVPSSPTKNDIAPPVIVQNQTLSLPWYEFENTVNVLRRTFESSPGLRDVFRDACLSAVGNIVGSKEDDEKTLRSSNQISSSKRFAVMLRNRERSILLKYYNRV
jgi:hypothetical protein